MIQGMRSSLAALASVVAAGMCGLPLGTLLAAAGAGSAAVLVPPSLQPWLMGLAAVLIAFGAWRTFVRPSCATDRRWTHKTALVVSAVAVAAMWLAPQQVAGLIAGDSGQLEAPGDEARPIDSVEVLKAAFNAAHDETRLIVLLSPT
jgi:hypothetical protein